MDRLPVLFFHLTHTHARTPGGELEFHLTGAVSTLVLYLYMFFLAYVGFAFASDGTLFPLVCDYV